jgi:predicted kinase
MTDQQQHIADAYIKELQQQAEPQPPKFCICLIGLVGSGKSTLLDSLCQALPVVRHSGDRIRTLLHHNGLSDDGLMPIAIEASERTMAMGYNLACDNDFANPKARASFRDCARRNGYAEIWLRLNPPESFIVEHLRDDKHEYNFNSLERLRYQQQVHQDDAEAINALPFLNTLDPSRDDWDQQITLTLQRIRDFLASRR